VHLSECFLFAKVTTPKHTTVKHTTPRHTTPRHTTHKPTTRRHFAYADQATPDLGDMFTLIGQQLSKFVNPDTFTSLEGFWRFYYNNILKVIYENFFKTIVAPIVAQQLKIAGVTKNEDVDAFFETQIDTPVKQGLQILTDNVGPFIDNFNAADVIGMVNNYLDNGLKPTLNSAIDYIAENKATVKPKVMTFLNTEYAHEAMELLEDLKHMVKKDMHA